jgi:hypothetical protein
MNTTNTLEASLEPGDSTKGIMESTSSEEAIEPANEKIVFFDRRSLDCKKKKPKPIVYQIYLCSRCKFVNDTGSTVGSCNNLEASGSNKENIPDPFASTDSGEVGAWCALIVKRPQDVSGSSGSGLQTTYMLSGVERSHSHIRIRLRGVIESLNWITGNVPESQYPYIEATFVINDVFVVNTLREWLPKWRKNEFNMDVTSDERKRPNLDLLTEISNISSRINISVKWQIDQSNEMITLSEKIDKLLASAEAA